MNLKVNVVGNGSMPEYKTAGSAGMDLTSARDLVIPVGGRALVLTDISVEIPEGYEGQVRSRSGLALNHGVAVLNGIGTIDSDYRGSIGALLINLGSEPFKISIGDRIAQLVIAPVTRVTPVKSDSLSNTDRGAGGFGSTGK